ncbi:MAG TPA: penicillin-binding protein 2 [bacterium]|nr:penicillin-binding protein 2 [bacterium]HPV65757.1 penicillin-binding protein 2 [bacterium]
MFGKDKKDFDPFVVKEKKFKFGNLKDSFYHLGWMEDSFLFGENNNETLKKTFDSSKTKHIFSFLLLFFFILLARLFWLQIFKGDEYRAMAEGNRVRTVSIEPKRGIIYDSNRISLVKNEANFVLYLIPSEMPKDELERDRILRQLSFIIDNKTEDTDAQNVTENTGDYSSFEFLEDSDYFYFVKNKLDKIKYGSLESFRPLFIMDNLEHEAVIAISLETEKMPGVSLSVKMGRSYVGSESSLSSLSHVIGYTGKISEKDLDVFGEEYSLIDYIGKTGLEYFYENELKGQKGKKYTEVDALGREKKIINKTLPVDGSNLVLSLNSKLQAKIEEILKERLKKNNLGRSSVVVLDPRNGEILSLVSWPAYDNNIFSKGVSQSDYSKLLNDPDRPLFNRAVNGTFPSGSTLKPTIAAAALEEGVVKESTYVNSRGGINVGQWFFPDWKAGGHGMTDVKKAIAESVNTFFYYIGGGYENFSGLGIDRIVKYLNLFGLGAQSGLDLPQEARGFVPTPEWKEESRGEVWYIGNTYHVSIGQGDILVTPLQVANFTAFFANGGKLYRPHLVKEILDGENQLIRKIEPEIIRDNFISDKNIKIVKDGMRQTVVSGSARRLDILPYKISGKTGTAQWGTNKTPHAWFTSFAPYDDPEIVITILIEEGKEGSDLPVTIAGEIFDYYFSEKNR